MNEQAKKIDFLFVGQRAEMFARDVALLQRAGYQHVLFVEGAVKARTVLRQIPVDFVIAELEMPLMNGMELLKLIRRNATLVDLPVLLIAADKHKDMVLYAIEEQVDGYLAEPYSGEDLLCAVIKIQLHRKNLTAAQEKMRQARHAFLDRQYGPGIKLAKEVLAEEAENSEALYLLSESYYRLRELEKAKKFLNVLLKLQPQNYKAMHLLSKVSRVDTQAGDAFSSLLSAHNQNPLNVELTIDLGKLYLDMAMAEKAEEVFAAVMAANPTDLNLVKMGRAYLKKEQLGEACRYLDQTVQPLPELAYIFKELAEKLLANGDLEGAVRQFEKCRKMAPHDGEGIVALGKLYTQLGREEEAKEVLFQFLQDHPDEPTVSGMLHSLGAKK